MLRRHMHKPVLPFHQEWFPTQLASCSQGCPPSLAWIPHTPHPAAAISQSLNTRSKRKGNSQKTTRKGPIYQIQSQNLTYSYQRPSSVQHMSLWSLLPLCGMSFSSFSQEYLLHLCINIYKIEKKTSCPTTKHISYILSYFLICPETPHKHTTTQQTHLKLAGYCDPILILSHLNTNGASPKTEHKDISVDFLPMFSLASPLTRPLVSLLPVRDTLNRSEQDFTMWLLLGSNSLLETSKEGQEPDLVWLLSGFKGTCFLPVGTCFIGQLTS